MSTGLKKSFVDVEESLFGEGVTRWRLLNIFMAEMIGTGMLVFWGCMAVVLGLSHLEICLAFGLVVASIIQIFGHISAAHLNPSVTVAAVVLGHVNIPLAALYILAECLGAILGYKLLLLITPTEMLFNPITNMARSCCTHPVEVLGNVGGIAVEFLLTSILIFLLCGCWDKRNSHNTDSLALKFGFAVAALALSGGPYTGASMNPARSLGPAVWDWSWRGHFVYWIGPLSAGLLVSAFYRFIFDRQVKQPLITSGEDIPLNDTRKQIESNA